MKGHKLTMKCTYPDCKCGESGCEGFGELKSIYEAENEYKAKMLLECEHKELMKNGDSYYCIKCRKPYVPEFMKR